MQTPSLRPAIFLDRDGVINENRSDHVKNWEEFRFFPFSFEALRALKASPYLVILVTNQAAIGRGLLSRETVEEIHNQMQSCIEMKDGRIDGIYYCPHTPADGCDCRKPRPGMLLQAAREHGIDLPASYVIGDKLSDLQAGEALGCRGILVKTGEDRAADLPANSRFAVAENLLSAVKSLPGLERA